MDQITKQSHVFIFMGRSGSGKGTQIELLQTYLKEKGQTNQQLFVCGDAFRNFFKSGSYLSSFVKESVNDGNYQPDFLATTLFFTEIFKTINATDHLFFDGYPRSLKQLTELKELLTYVGHTHATVVVIDVEATEVVKRMVLRGRPDDTEGAAEKRQAEFTREVIPVLDAIKQDSFFTYKEVDGMPAPQDVHKNVLEALAL
jgi:adenylate kinase